MPGGYHEAYHSNQFLFFDSGRSLHTAHFMPTVLTEGFHVSSHLLLYEISSMTHGRLTLEKCHFSVRSNEKLAHNYRY